MADHSNPSRNILIVGALLGLAAAGLGVYTMTSAETKAVDSHVRGAKTPAAELTAEAEQSLASVRQVRTLADVAPEGAMANGKPRVIPFFFSAELWEVPPQDGGKTYNVVDIYDPTVEAIHKGIPNAWFLQHGLIDALSVSDGDAQDSDKDGFSNREEYEAGTNPMQVSSLPPLVQVEAGKPVKLEVVDVHRSHATITVDSMFASDPDPTSVNIKVFHKVEDQRPVVKCTLEKGKSFGIDEKGNPGRFTIVGFEKKTFTDSTGAGFPENVLHVRDNEALTPDGKEFIVRAGRPRATDKDRGTPNEKGHTVNDVSATLRVTAGPMAGQAGGTFRVPLHGSFKIPGDEKINCLLESVDANGNVNIRPEGAQSPINIPRAAK